MKVINSVSLLCLALWTGISLGSWQDGVRQEIKALGSSWQKAKVQITKGFEAQGSIWKDNGIKTKARLIKKYDVNNPQAMRNVNNYVMRVYTRELPRDIHTLSGGSEEIAADAKKIVRSLGLLLEWRGKWLAYRRTFDNPNPENGETFGAKPSERATLRRRMEFIEDTYRRWEWVAKPGTVEGLLEAANAVATLPDLLGSWFPSADRNSAVESANLPVDIDKFILAMVKLKRGNRYWIGAINYYRVFESDMRWKPQWKIKRYNKRRDGTCPPRQYLCPGVPTENKDFVKWVLAAKLLKRIDELVSDGFRRPKEDLAMQALILGHPSPTFWHSKRNAFHKLWQRREGRESLRRLWREMRNTRPERNHGISQAIEASLYRHARRQANVRNGAPVRPPANVQGQGADQGENDDEQVDREIAEEMNNTDYNNANFEGAMEGDDDDAEQPQEGLVAQQRPEPRPTVPQTSPLNTGLDQWIQQHPGIAGIRRPKARRIERGENAEEGVDHQETYENGEGYMNVEQRNGQGGGDLEQREQDVEDVMSVEEDDEDRVDDDGLGTEKKVKLN